MSFDTLKPEIWDNVIRFLRPTTPLPLSGLAKEEAVDEFEYPDRLASLPCAGAPGTTSRKDIKADALCCLMRTSPAFNNLTYPHLYRNIITDQFESLTSYLDSPPAHPHILRKSELLKETRHLSIEYSSKADEPTYRDLLKGPGPEHEVHPGGRYWRGVGAPLPYAWAVLFSIIKLDQFSPHLLDLAKRPPIFDKLTHLFVGRVFGGQVAGWRRAGSITDESGLIARKIEKCNRLLEKIFRPSPLEHFCQRGSGPLSMPCIITKWRKSRSSRSIPTPLSLIIHHDARDASPPTAVGHRTRWVIEERQALLWDVCEIIMTSLGQAKRHRAELGLHPSGFDFEIFASSRRIGPLGYPEEYVKPSDIRLLNGTEEKKEAEDMASSTLKEVMESDIWKAGDAVSWRALADAPPCACGWEFKGDKVTEEGQVSEEVLG